MGRVSPLLGLLSVGLPPEALPMASASEPSSPAAACMVDGAVNELILELRTLPNKRVDGGY